MYALVESQTAVLKLTISRPPFFLSHGGNKRDTPCTTIKRRMAYARMDARQNGRP